jgi:hypothetical protein
MFASSSLKKKTLNLNRSSTVRRGGGDILNKKDTIHCVSTE